MPVLRNLVVFPHGPITVTTLTLQGIPMQRAVGVFRQLSRAPEPFYWVLRNPILIYFRVYSK